MTICGHGIDLVAIGRVVKLLAESSADFLEATFTPSERQGSEGSVSHAAYFAGRFAAKEAVAKALGTGFSGEIAWTDIEVLRGATGNPEVWLSGGALARAQSLGITGWLLSISHDDTYAVASAIAVADEITPPRP